MIDRAAATRWKRIAQGGAVGCVALIAAFLAWPSARPSLPPDDAQLPVVPIEGTLARDPVPGADPARISDGLNLVANRPRATEVAQDPKDTPAPPPPPPPSDSLVYLGLAKIGSTNLALIRDGEKQRFIRVGDKINDAHTLEQAEDDHVVVGPDGRKIPKSPRTGSALTQAVAAPPPNPAPGAMEQSAVAQRQRLEAMRNARGQAPTPTAPSPGAPPLGPGVRPGGFVTQGGFRIDVPAGFSAQDTQLWRKLRAQLIISGEDSDTAGAAALRQLPTRRDELLEQGDLSREELDAEDTVARQRKEKKPQ